MFQEFIVLYCRTRRIFINHKSLLSVISWRWLLIVGRSKIWTFARTVNLLAFPKVVCKGGLPLLKLFLLLPSAKAEGWEVCAWKLAFMNWNLCYGLSGGLISLELTFLGELVFNLNSCKCSVFCFAASILRYSFFLCLHYLSHDMWAPLHNRHFSALSWWHFKVLCGPEQVPYFVIFWSWTKT